MKSLVFTLIVLGAGALGRLMGVSLGLQGIRLSTLPRDDPPDVGDADPLTF